MEDIKKVELYDIRNNNDSFSLRAYINPFNGKLYFEGQDFCETAKEMFGDEEYEYYYVFSENAVKKLKVILNNEDVLDGLVAFYDGKMRDNEFDELCKINKIRKRIHVV